MIPARACWPSPSPRARRRRQADEPWKAPRGPGGVNPDLNGVWQALNEANWDIERHMARASLEMRDGPISPVPSVATLRMGTLASVPPGPRASSTAGGCPTSPRPWRRRDENRARWSELDPEVKCYLPGIPRANYMGQPFQIFQGENNLEFVYQYRGINRNILMEDPGPAPGDFWMGQSVARWEGDTLVVEVTALNDQTWFDRAGNHHSGAMTVTERFHADRPGPPAATRRRSRTPRRSRSRGRCACRCTGAWSRTPCCSTSSAWSSWRS